MIVWLIGLSGAGKTTIGKELYQKMKSRNNATVFVDGDEVRNILKADQSESDYSVESRKINADRIQQICAWLDRQGIDVVCCILSIFPETLEWNRKHYSDYYEVFVDVSFENLARRHPKNLYGLAAEGKMKNVVGHDIEFSPPVNPDMVIQNEEPYKSSESLAQDILNNIDAFITQ